MGVKCDFILVPRSQFFEYLRETLYKHALEHLEVARSEKKKEKRVFFLRKHLAVIDLLEGLSLVGTYFRRYRQSYRQS